jgi:caspase domain-containing protein
MFVKLSLAGSVSCECRLTLFISLITFLANPNCPILEWELMRFKLPTLTYACAIAAFILFMLPDKLVAAQNDPRGLRSQNQGEQRVALVIGNGSYKDSPLSNPVNDARAIAEALRSFGFDVIYGENLSQNDMKRNIRAFGAKIRNGGVGLFYYAGHGIQIDGRNYLIPVGATITTEEEVEYESIDVGLALAQMESAHNRLNIVILDACRNNPFARAFRSVNSGLASINAPSGTLIAYATAPGSVASDGTQGNGLYTQQLLKYLRMTDLSIEQVFKQVRVAVRSQTDGKQVPWESSSLEGEFYISTQAAPSNAASNLTSNLVKSNPPPTTLDPVTVELSFWDSIKNSAEMDDYKAYLDKYPSGTFVALARNKIRNLEANAKPPSSVVSAPVEPTPSPVSREAASPPARTVTLRDIELSYKSNLIDEAIKNAKIFLETTPNSKEAHAYLGYSLMLKKDVDGAVVHLERAVSLGEPMTFPVKRLREPLIGHGLDDATVTVTTDSVIIKTGKTFYQAAFSSLSESRIAYYNSQCPIVFLKGNFTESSENSQKSKQGVKQFNLFPPSATLQPMKQENLVYNLAACTDEGIITTGIIKLMYRVMTNRQ